ncbi:MAG: hypothetical protein HC875_31345 [Anaerolineales bacterium]|nr:hypothetical protein [Anaerolineales bacterium]
MINLDDLLQATGGQLYGPARPPNSPVSPSTRAGSNRASFFWLSKPPPATATILSPMPSGAAQPAFCVNIRRR